MADLEGAEPAPAPFVTVLLITDNGKNMHFRILKMIATSGFLAALECTKFVFGRGSAPVRAGELTALPRPHSCMFNGGSYF